MLRSANAGWTNRPGGTDVVRPLQPTKRRLTATPRAKRRSSLGTTAELLSAGTLNQPPTVDSLATSSPKGQTTSMREFVQIDSASDHACGQPSVERWHVLEPVSERWSWVRVFGCCKQVVFEPVEEERKRQAARQARRLSSLGQQLPQQFFGDGLVGFAARGLHQLALDVKDRGCFACLVVRNCRRIRFDGGPRGFFQG